MTLSQTDKERVRELAGRQQGRVTFGQLLRLGVAGSTIQSWVLRGDLVRVLPTVYAVGHTASSREADLWAAVLYAGPGAMLSHGSAAHWLGLIDHAPPKIEVSTPRRSRSLGCVRVYDRRRGLDRYMHRDLPVTSIPMTMLDLAATGTPRALGRALGQLDFLQRLDVESLIAACGSGRAGASRLRAAIDGYDPRRKYTNGPLEEAFYELCVARGLPRPLLNAYVHDLKVDAYWPAQGLVVELDGAGNHSSPAQRRRDQGNDLRLRSKGLTVHRYGADLVREHGDAVVRDVLLALERLDASNASLRGVRVVCGGAG